MEAEFTLEQLRWAVQGAGVGVWQWEIASDRVNWSLEMGLLFGVPVSAFPKNVAEFSALLHPEDRDAVQKAIEEALATRLQSFSIEHRILKPDGSVRWIGGKGRVESDGQGSPLRLAGTAMDISHQKAVELQAAQFRIFTELASDYIYVAEVPEGTPLAPSIVAGSFERATGYTALQVAQKGGWTSIIHPDDLPTLGPVYAGVAAGKPMVAEYRIVGPDGEIRWLRDHVRPELKDGVLIRMTGGVQDITERKKLEEKLNHAQRMEALARLAGSVAHDFNNILFVISASVELMRPAFARSEDAMDLAEDVRTSCKRASELTRTLLTFGRKVPTNAQVVSLNAAVAQCQTILARAAGERVRLDVDVSSATAPVELDVAQLQLVLLNLTLNAQAAMPDGGDLRICVRPGEQRDGRHDEIKGESFVVIEVSDTGSGIPPEIMARIFEPFFTTKGPIEGSGLGLATCHGIVTQAGGAIRVTSQAGIGSTFTIYLPTTTPLSTLVGAPRSQGSVGGTEAILLLEDEPAVRRLTRRILEDHGYTVEAAGSVTEARDLYGRRKFAMLLSDIRLPDGNGASFAEELRMTNAELRIVLISGFAEGDAMAIIERNRFRLLHKPFGAEALARLVRETLDGISTDAPAGSY